MRPVVLAITKCDMVDDELRELLQPELPEGIETRFISAVSGEGITELKDLLWEKMNL